MKRMISIILCVMMISTWTCSLGETKVKHGTADGFGSEIKVDVTVEDGKIVGLSVDDSKESYQIAGVKSEDSVDKLIEGILLAGNVDDVDTKTGATITSNAIVEAVRNALNSNAEDIIIPDSVSVAGVEGSVSGSVSEADVEGSIPGSTVYVVERNMETVLNKLQPYTDVNLSVLQKKGFTCIYDDFRFSAEFYPPENKILSETSLDKYSVSFDIKAVYSMGKVLLVPRIIFTRSGIMTYYSAKTSDIYIKNGENRYLVILDGVSRDTDSRNYNAIEYCIEPVGLKGSLMLADIAANSDSIEIRFGNSDEMISLSSEQISTIQEFYNACKEAGIFDQEELFQNSDHYYVITLFNSGSVGTEDQLNDLDMEISEGKADE